jgi:hypothetical protein
MEHLTGVPDYRRECTFHLRQTSTHFMPEPNLSFTCLCILSSYIIPQKPGDEEYGHDLTSSDHEPRSGYGYQNRRCSKCFTIYSTFQRRHRSNSTSNDISSSGLIRPFEGIQRPEPSSYQPNFYSLPTTSHLLHLPFRLEIVRTRTGTRIPTAFRSIREIQTLS